MIQVTDLVKTYSGQQVPAVAGVSFRVGEGRFYTLLGPSGCGKTTTLRCIAGLERPDSGTIELDEIVVVSDRVNVPTHRRDLGMVFQSYAVWPHMNVFENVAFPLRVGRQRPDGATMRKRVMDALTLVGLSGLEKRMATQLSGGQQQRLSLARAIVREPKVLLLDEPLSNLDAKLRERMRGELSLIQRRLGVTTLFVTHDQIEALSMSDRVAVMNNGLIVQEGSPRDVYHEPATEFVASFIGATNLIEGDVGSGAAAGGSVGVRTPLGVIECECTSDWAAGDRVVVAFRPEDIGLHRGTAGDHDAKGRPNVFPGTVQLGLFTGTSVDYHIDVGGAIVHARSGSRRPLERGDDVQVELPPHACRVFSATTMDPEQGDTGRTLAALAANQGAEP